MIDFINDQWYEIKIEPLTLEQVSAKKMQNLPQELQDRLNNDEELKLAWLKAQCRVRE